MKGQTVAFGILEKGIVSDGFAEKGFFPQDRSAGWFDATEQRLEIRIAVQENKRSRFGWNVFLPCTDSSPDPVWGHFIRKKPHLNPAGRGFHHFIIEESFVEPFGPVEVGNRDFEPVQGIQNRIHRWSLSWKVNRYLNSSGYFDGKKAAVNCGIDIFD